MNAVSTVFEEIKLKFEQTSGLRDVQYELKERPGKSVMILKVANPTERLYGILQQVLADYETDTDESPLVTLKKQAGDSLLVGPEGKLLLRTLAESLNINRHSFQSDFLSRYTQSVSGAEEQVTAAANHVVFGRRGAGKSTLLLYTLHTRNVQNRASVWIDMQVYARREDEGIISDVLLDILSQLLPDLIDRSDYGAFKADLISERQTLDGVRRHLPMLRRILSYYADHGADLFIFLDDFHVLASPIQPKLLDALYAIARGNRIYLKLSAIETLTKTYDPKSREGLEIPHDADKILLDYNLTMPEKATSHIEAILDSHAKYCGLPGIRRLCTSPDVLSRLTWVAAGVPRDALSLFSQALTKAAKSNRKLVSISNVNVAASESLNTKLRDLDHDAFGVVQPLKDLLDTITDFCVRQNRCNAFLVEIKNEDIMFNNIRTLVDLRLLHVISEGITPNVAGRKYLGLLLDFGFYTGVRAARSVQLFESTLYKDLRKLPVFCR